MQYLRYLKQFFQIMFKIENKNEKPSDSTEKMDDDGESDEEQNDSDNEDDELKTGSEKILLTAVGIGYHNLTKTLI
jgi:hypothetical protein